MSTGSVTLQAGSKWLLKLNLGVVSLFLWVSYKPYFYASSKKWEIQN